ncbi:hypothetical protein RB597_001476 [Gaeumannomyces tritici]
MSGQGAPAGGSNAGYGGASRPSEDRNQGKDQMMSNLRENSQQDRRVYVGNLSYDVKWHHLKDFMRQGASPFRSNWPWLSRRTSGFWKC